MSYLQTVSSSNFVESYIFSQPIQNEEEKNVLDFVFDYATSTSGLLDIAQFFTHAVEWVKKFSNFSENNQQLLSNTHSVLDIATSILTFPEILADSLKIVKSLFRCKNDVAISTLDKKRYNKIYNSTHTILVSGLTLMKDCAKAAQSLHHFHFIDLGNFLPYVQPAFHASSIILDGGELIDEIQNVHKNQEKLKTALSEGEKEKLQNKMIFSFIKIIKDSSSVAAAALSLMALLFCSAVAPIVIHPNAILALSSLWILSKVVSYFYEKIVINSKAEDKFNLGCVF